MVTCIICIVLVTGVIKSSNIQSISQPSNRSTQAAFTEEPIKTYAPDPFYGVWCYSTKDMSVAQSKADELSEHGLNGHVYITSEWRNLNQEKWYAVSAGESLTEADAKKVLKAVQNAGYSKAYIRYTGEYKG